MIPEDATGEVVRHIEVAYIDKGTGEGCVILNKPDGPGRWHWQIVWYHWEPGDQVGTSIDAYSTYDRREASTTWATRRAALMRRVDERAAVVNVDR